MAEANEAQQAEREDWQDQQPSDEEAEQQSTEEEGAASEGEDEEQDGSARKGKDRFQKRIKSLTKKRYEAERRAAEAEQRAKELEKRLSETETKADPRPTPDSFDTFDDYEQELIAWDRRQREREQQQGAESTEDRSDTSETDPEMVRIFDTVDNAALEAQDSYPDFEDVVIKRQDLPLTKPVLQTVVDSDHVADILYYLGQNPEEARRFAEMGESSPNSLPREVGRLEAAAERGELNAAGGGPSNEGEAEGGEGESAGGRSGQSGRSAPPPIRTPGETGRGSGRGRKHPDNMDTEEWLEWRRQNKRIT